MSGFGRGVDTLKVDRPVDNLIWACGGMVDTLVLGTSAQAWEFESLHAQFEKVIQISVSLFQYIK